MRLKIFFVVVSHILSGCTSTQSSDVKTSQKTILDQSPGHQVAPKWILGTLKNTVSDKKIPIRGYISMDAGSRPEACTGAAVADAKGKMVQQISSTVADKGGFSGDQKNIVAERLVVALSKQKLVGVETEEEYWQLVEINRGNGEKAERLDCWALTTIPQNVMENALKRALSELEKNDPEIQEHKEKLNAAIQALEE